MSTNDHSPISNQTARWRQVTLRVFKVIAALYLSVLGIMMFFEESLIYFPTKYPNGNWDLEDREDAWFAAEDGTKLHGWFVEHPQPKFHLLYLHGNADYVANLSGTANLYRDEFDANVLVFDYRGYGRSEGKPNEQGVVQDSAAARQWLAQRVSVPESEIVLIGRSLGGGAATSVAAQLTPKALVLQNTFSSLPDVAATHYPWLPVKWCMRNRFDSVDHVQHCRCPVFQSHGTADRVVPIALAKRLYEQIGQPKQFFEIEGGFHNDLEPPEYFEQLNEFLHAHCLNEHHPD